MKTFFGLLLIVFVGLFIIAAGPANENRGAAEISIDSATKGMVAFPHKTHQDTLNDCNTCHMLFPQESGSIQKLIGQEKLQKKQVMNHCRDCHKDKKNAGEKAGPTSCSKCHPKPD